MGIQLSDFGATTLAANLAAGDTTMSVVDSTLFPDCSITEDYTYVTLFTDIASEVVKVTGMSGNEWIIDRIVSNPLAWSTGTEVELRVNKALLTDLTDKSEQINGTSIAMAIALGG